MGTCAASVQRPVLEPQSRVSTRNSAVKCCRGYNSGPGEKQSPQGEKDTSWAFIKRIINTFLHEVRDL